VVGIIYQNKDFIITKRPIGGLLGGLWELPGGKIETGEAAKNALLREIKEELNINVDINDKLSVVGHEYSHFKVTISPYICAFKNGDIKLNGSTEWQWINMNRINTKSFPKATHKVFDLIRNINI